MVLIDLWSLTDNVFLINVPCQTVPKSLSVDLHGPPWIQRGPRRSTGGLSQANIVRDEIAKLAEKKFSQKGRFSRGSHNFNIKFIKNCQVHESPWTSVDPRGFSMDPHDMWTWQLQEYSRNPINGTPSIPAQLSHKEECPT